MPHGSDHDQNGCRSGRGCKHMPTDSGKRPASGSQHPLHPALASMLVEVSLIDRVFGNSPPEGLVAK
jgi:hypothetical protein